MEYHPVASSKIQYEANAARRSGPAAGTDEAAAWWRRLIARALDVLVVFFVLLALVVTGIFWYMGDLVDAYNPEPWGDMYVPSITFTVMYLLMEVMFLPRGGQTPGKATMSITTEAMDGGRLSHPRAALRWLLPGLVFGFVLLPYPIIGAVVLAALYAPALLPERRTVHDYLAGTRVTDREETEHEREEREQFEKRLEDLKLKAMPRSMRKLLP